MNTINIHCSLIPTDKKDLANSLWLRQFPDGKPEWQGWRFIFNAVDANYDYMVAIRNLSAPIKPNCPLENTIHITLEPPAIKKYEDDFVAQFGAVITQDADTRHPRTILHHSGLPWLLGSSMKKDDNNFYALSFNELQQLFDQPKKKLISVISSDKISTPGHVRRLAFATRLKQHFADKIDLFGHGLANMDDKLEALQDYRFHIAMENSNTDHYFSEKITDTMIAGCYPIYYGCPNAESYFPDKSFLRIDIDNFAASVAAIEEAINQNYDVQYREQLRLARDMSMNEHNIYPMLVKIITELENGKYGKAKPVLRDEYMLPYKHAKMRPIYKLLWIKRDRLNIFRWLYLCIVGSYFRHLCKKLLAKDKP